MRDTLQSYPIITRIHTTNGIQQAEVHWSVDTTQGYAVIPMTPTNNDSFIAEIPRQPGYNQIFYFISARSNSGKLITRPLTAPAGYYTLDIEAVSGLDENPKSISQSPILYPNYPNPFNPVTTISWQLEAGSMVNLSVYNSSGQKIVELVSGEKPAGFHKVGFNATGLASGEAILPFKDDLGDYSVSKAGVIALTRALAKEHARHGFRVNVILPGGILTSGTRNAAKQILHFKFSLIKSGIEFAQRLPIRRAGKPDEVARVALMLASDFATYIHGALIPVDGGFLAA